MKKIFVAATIVATIGLMLGIYSLLQREERPVLCELRNFDYVKFLDLVRKDASNTLVLINDASVKPTDALSPLKIGFLESKRQLLSHLIPLVEKQIETGGASYSCTEDGYKLFMGEISIPTFSSMAREHEIEWLWEKIEKRQETSFLKILEIILGPLVLLIVSIMGLIQARAINKKPPSNQAL